MTDGADRDAAPVVALSGVHFAYNGRQVLSDVSLTVRRGDFLAVLGPNGGGKTTLLRLVLGLIRPDRGRVEVFGQSPEKARGRVGYVPQRLYGGADCRDFPVSVLDVALMGFLSPGRRGFRFSRPERDRARAVLDKVDMLGLERRRFGELSGGQQKRALIARALVSEPELLILDEPTADIDPGGRFCFHDLLAKAGAGATTVAVSHDLSILAGGVTAVACLNGVLATSPGPVLTEEMFTLLYGLHRHSCPMDHFIRTLPGRLGDLRQGAA